MPGEEQAIASIADSAWSHWLQSNVNNSLAAQLSACSVTARMSPDLDTKIDPLHFRPLVAYQYGINDYPFQQFRVGIGYVF